MKCPYCGVASTKVIDSRPSDDNSAIRRRRQCEVCGMRFTTFEKVETFPLMVIKKDQSREEYSREKIKAGVYVACHKRPVSSKCLDHLVDEVETMVFSLDEREVESKVIGEIVMEKLKKLDEVAYVRFASVYRSFTDVDTFARELMTLLQKEK